MPSDVEPVGDGVAGIGKAAPRWSLDDPLNDFLDDACLCPLVVAASEHWRAANWRLLIDVFDLQWIAEYGL